MNRIRDVLDRRFVSVIEQTHLIYTWLVVPMAFHKYEELISKPKLSSFAFALCFEGIVNKFLHKYLRYIQNVIR